MKYNNYINGPNSQGDIVSANWVAKTNHQEHPGFETRANERKQIEGLAGELLNLNMRVACYGQHCSQRCPTTDVCTTSFPFTFFPIHT